MAINPKYPDKWLSPEDYLREELLTKRSESIGLKLTVEEIYARVDNEDVRTFFEEKRLVSESALDL